MVDREKERGIALRPLARFRYDLAMRVTVRAISVLMLLLLLVILARVAPHRDARPDFPAGPEVAARPALDPAGDRTDRPAAEKSPGIAGNKAAESSPAKPATGVERWEGVLYRARDVIQIQQADIPDPEVLPFHKYSPYCEDMLIPSLVDGPLLKPFRKGSKHRFRGFLQGDDEHVPPAFVHLVVEVPADPPEKENAPPDDGPATPPEPREVLRVVEAEDLGDEWLNAWRDLYRAACEVETRLAEPPGPERRSRIIPSIAELKSALDRARQARSGDSIVRWRVRAETACVETVARELFRIGLADELGWGPFTRDLNEAFRSAGSRDEFRELVMGTWGEPALAREIRIDLGRSEAPVSGLTTVAALLALSEKDFAHVLKMLSINEEKERLVALDHTHEQRAPGTMPEWFGLRVENASPEECAQLLLDGAAVVRDVTPGSPAALAGFIVGDSIWQVSVTGMLSDDSESLDRTTLVDSVAKLARDVGICRSLHGDVQFGVIRDGFAVKLAIPLPGLSEEEKQERREAYERERAASESLNRPPEQSDDSR